MADEHWHEKHLFAERLGNSPPQCKEIADSDDDFGPYKNADKFLIDMKFLFEDEGLNGAVLRGLGLNSAMSMSTKSEWESKVAAVAASKNCGAFVNAIVKLYKGKGLNAEAYFGSMFNRFGSTKQAADQFLRFYGKPDVLALVDFQGMPPKRALENAVLIRAGLYPQPTAEQVKIANDIINALLELDLLPDYEENPSSEIYMIERALGGYPNIMRE